MAWSFGDSFDCYAAPADAINGYWDSGTVGGVGFLAGRFAGSQALSFSTSAQNIVKSSGVNDAVHHFALAFRQTATLTGTNPHGYLELFDGTTAQCTVVFRSDGAILLTSGGPTGTTLATYTGGVVAPSTWYAFEFEIIINNTTGRFRVRKNGNTVDDFDSGAVLDTQNSANAYANKLQVGVNNSLVGGNQLFDDLFWRSDASSVAWMGDIRCFTRMPASDASVQFSRSPALATQTPFSGTTLQSMTSTNSFYAPITASFTGSVGIVTVSVAAGFTGNLKCSVFNDSAGNPGTVVASGPTITNPTTGVNTYTFSTPFAVTKSAAYWIAFVADGSYSNVLFTTNSAVGKYSAFVSYAAFPTATPTMSGGNNAVICSWSINTTNNALVSEPQQDGTTSYVYDSTPGDADFYNIGTIASTPLATVAVTTRGFMQKSDAGTRTAAVQIKSGGTTVASPTATLSSNFGWVWRTDSTDPATGTAWSATGVNNATIGPRTVA